MREILFRGKRIYPNKDTGQIEWVYGHYMTVYGVPNIEHDNKQSDIDRNTLGQYTGLKDRNDKRIFEGDIVKWDINLFGVVCFGETEEGLGGERHLAFWVKWVEKSSTGYETMLKRDLPFLAGQIEVIGNIHDNPELLENEVK